VIAQPMYVLAVILVILAGLFAAERTRIGQGVFRFVPMIVFAYFVPALLSNLDVLPVSSPLYAFIKAWLLPASLVLLTLSVDIPAIARLGRPAVVLFLTGTLSVMIGGPLAYLALGWLAPESLGEETWKGLAALTGSWIGGGANFVAVGASVGAADTTLGLMAVVDVVIANIWMAFLLAFAGRQRAMDAAIGADRTAIDEVQVRIERYQLETTRAATVGDFLAIVAVAIGGTAIAHAVARELPDLGDIITGFTWVVILVTTIGVALSFTPVRRLEGAGASKIGSVFLYLLIASIGAGADFRRAAEAWTLLLIAALWMAIHAAAILLVRRWMRAPIFFAAVGSQANIGGAASAPVVAAAFHPSLAPVGILLAVAGYVLGTYCALLSAYVLRAVHAIW
jgi:uncharacterized membrane protein